MGETKTDIAKLQEVFRLLGELAVAAASKPKSVLVTAAVAYESGKITKQQYLAVIDAVDETCPTSGKVVQKY